MSERARILVADDEPNLRRVLTAMLKRDGHDVVQATDGAEALELITPGGTELDFRQEQFFDEAVRDGHLRGWSESLAKLDAYIAKLEESGAGSTA